MSNFYPNINEGQLKLIQIVIDNMENNPEYLSDPRCPYNEKIKAFFEQRAAVTSVGDMFEVADEAPIGEYDKLLDKQIEKILNDLENFGNSLSSSDVSEKLQYFKTKTTLIDRLVGMRERVMNLKELNEFRGAILSFMDEVCTKDQITQLMQRLDGIFGNDDR